MSAVLEWLRAHDALPVLIVAAFALCVITAGSAISAWRYSGRHATQTSPADRPGSGEGTK